VYYAYLLALILSRC